MNYKVAEIFTSVQGEGFHTGTLMCFLRLSGCNLTCSWCDTEHQVKYMAHESQIMNLIMSELKGTKIDIVCITGGEPTIYDLSLLIRTLQGRYVVHLETNGTRELKGFEMPDWITVSPKFPPGFDAWKQRRGSELKLAVWDDISEDMIQKCFKIGSFNYRYLQPVDDSNLEKNALRCVQAAAMETEWRISMQGHKRLRLP